MTEAKLRRKPTQERSKRRFEAILDAAGELFSDVGFDATTMEAVAERAGTSIGSVYQFFPNKLAVFRAMAERCHEQSRRTVAMHLGGDPASRSLGELTDSLIDGFAALQDDDPAFRALWINFQLYGEYAEADEAMMDEFAELATGLLAVKAPGVPARKRKLVASLIIQVITAMLFLVTRTPKRGRRAVIDESKLVVRRYLAGYE